MEPYYKPWLCWGRRDLDSKGMRRVIKSCFPEYRVYDERANSTDDVLCTLAYIMGYISSPELAMMAGPYFVGQTIRNTLTNLSNKKNDYLQPYPFKKMRGDMGARKAFRLTKKGFDKVSELLPDYLKMNNPDGYKRNSNPEVAGHEYGLGVTLLSIILEEEPFYFRKEVTCTHDALYNLRIAKGIKTKDALVIDCQLEFPRSRLFCLIEQDTGSENIRELFEKLSKYDRYEWFAPNTVIMFSYHRSVNMPQQPCFRSEIVKAIYQDMTEKGKDSLANYYKEYAFTLTVEEKQAICQLLVLMGRYKSIVDKPFERIKNLEELEEKSEGYKCYEGDSWFAKNELIFLRNHAYTLKNGININRMNLYYDIQVSETNNRIRNLVKWLYQNIVPLGTFQTVISSLCVYDCLFTPSLFAGPIFEKWQRRDRKKLFWNNVTERVLPQYFNLDGVEVNIKISNILEKDRYGRRINVERALLTAEKRLIICFDMDYNISSYFRLFYLSQALWPEDIRQIWFVALTNNEDEMIEIHKMLEKTGCDLDERQQIAFMPILDKVNGDILLRINEENRLERMEKRA